MERHTATLVRQAHSNRALSLFDYSPDPGDVVGFVWSTAEAAMVCWRGERHRFVVYT